MTSAQSLHPIEPLSPGSRAPLDRECFDFLRLHPCGWSPCTNTEAPVHGGGRASSPGSGSGFVPIGRGGGRARGAPAPGKARVFLSWVLGFPRDRRPFFPHLSLNSRSFISNKKWKRMHRAPSPKPRNKGPWRAAPRPPGLASRPGTAHGHRLLTEN